MSDPKSSKPRPDTMVAFRSAMQVIYEQLMVAFGDSMETLRTLQAASATDQVAVNASEGADESKVSRADLLDHVAEVEQTIANLLEQRDVPSQQSLARLHRDLDALDAALDQRLADLESRRQQSAA